MKKASILAILLTAFTVSGISYLGYEYYSFKTQKSAILPSYNSINILAESTPTVIKCKVSGRSTNFNYDNLGFIKTQVDIKDIYRDDYNLKKGDKITILQSDINEDPVINKNDDLVLFIEKYEGPITNDAYVIKGCMQGHFTVKNNKIYSKTNKEWQIYKSTASGIDEKDLKSTLENVKFKKPDSIKLSEEEIEKQNQHEKELEKAR